MDLGRPLFLMITHNRLGVILIKFNVPGVRLNPTDVCLGLLVSFNGYSGDRPRHGRDPAAALNGGCFRS